MSQRRWDERCPHCGEKIDIHTRWVDRDYENEFEMDCPACERLIDVFVFKVPEFGLAKAEAKTAARK